MAILISEQDAKTNWTAFAIVGAIIIVLLALTYYLFFAPTPLIDRIDPPDLTKVSDLSKIDISDTAVQQVTGHPVILLLKPAAGPPPPVVFGRPNPFITF